MWVPRSWPGSWCPHSDGSAESSECGFHDPGQDRGACVLMAGRVIRMWVPRYGQDWNHILMIGRPSEHKHHDMARIGTHILMAGRVIRMWVPRCWPGSWCLCSDGRPSHQNVAFHDPGQDRGAHILMARPVIRMWVPRSWPGSWCLCSDGSAGHQNVGTTILARIVVLVF